MKLNFSRDAAFYIAMCFFPICGMFSEGELLSRFDVKTEFFRRQGRRTGPYAGRRVEHPAGRRRDFGDRLKHLERTRWEHGRPMKSEPWRFRAYYAWNACFTASVARLQAFRGKDLRTNSCRAVKLFQS
jgi:hypothetical protein